MPRQLSQEELDRAHLDCERQDLLDALLQTSVETFGIHWRHYPHVFNYPWIASRLEKLGTGSTALEIGAGANPLPLYLASRGLKVDTIDNSEIVRGLPPDDDWNEWGYLDYGMLHSSISSFNADVTAFQPPRRYDAIFSVSVLSLMPTPVREEKLRLCRSWLNPQGMLLLAIDLIPGTDTLWNRGGSNESAEQHGAYHDVERQLTDLGFRITESRIMREVWHSRTDLHFLEAQL